PQPPPAPTNTNTGSQAPTSRQRMPNPKPDAYQAATPYPPDFRRMLRLPLLQARRYGHRTRPASWAFSVSPKPAPCMKKFVGVDAEEKTRAGRVFVVRRCVGTLCHFGVGLSPTA